VVSRLSSVMDAAPLGIAFTRNQKFELVSKAWCRLLQREEHELLGGATSEVFAEEGDYQLLGAQVGAAFLAQGTYEGEWRFRRKDGTEFWGQLCGRPADTQDAMAGTIWTLADITSSRTNRKHLEWSSTHDPLTGLANRKAFEHKLEQVMGHPPAAVLMIDLDRFKPINDTHGHAAGDEMLRAVALALSANVRAGDVVARLGGDEFAVILERCPLDAAERVATQALRAVMTARVPWGDSSLCVGASIGLACLENGYGTAAEWVADADRSCYAAKAAGRGTLRAASPGIAASIPSPTE
jgi:diguanylate cyclase